MLFLFFSEETDLVQQVVGTQPDPDILTLLGAEEVSQTLYSDPLHPDVASRWIRILHNGLSAEIKQDLVNKYLPPKNCMELTPPEINPEVKIAVADNTLRRDIRLAQLQ